MKGGETGKEPIMTRLNKLFKIKFERGELEKSPNIILGILKGGTGKEPKISMDKFNHKLSFYFQ